MMTKQSEAHRGRSGWLGRRWMSLLKATTLAAFGLAFGTQLANAGETLDAVRKADTVRCGIPSNSPGLAYMGAEGIWKGFHADICRAIAAATLGNASKVTFVTVTDVTRFTALQSGEIDVLVTASAYTLSRDTDLGLMEVTPYFYTGQGILVSKSTNIQTLQELDQATICSTQGSVIERTLADYAKANGISFTPVSYDTQEMVVTSFLGGRCDAISNDTLTLASNRGQSDNPDNYTVLPELLSKEPQGPYVRRSDPEWATLVKWTIFALLQAEEFGMTRENIDDQLSTVDPQKRRFLGLEGTPGEKLGLSPDWAYAVVKQVGNYGTLYEASIGKMGLGLDRGPNRLWKDGGLLISWLWQ
jgi:general L-amino acid transport system substrate-binding protein